MCVTAIAAFLGALLGSYLARRPTTRNADAVFADEMGRTPGPP